MRRCGASRAMRDAARPRGRKPRPASIGEAAFGRAGEPPGALESLDDAPHRPRLPSYPADRPRDLYGSLSTRFGITASLHVDGHRRDPVVSRLVELHVGTITCRQALSEQIGLRALMTVRSRPTVQNPFRNFNSRPGRVAPAGALRKLVRVCLTVALQRPKSNEPDRDAFSGKPPVNLTPPSGDATERCGEPAPTPRVIPCPGRCRGGVRRSRGPRSDGIQRRPR